METNEKSYEEVLSEMSIDELKNEISDHQETISYIRDVIEKKYIEEYDFEGKYLKIIETSCSEPTYIFCDTFSISKKYGSSENHLYFKGTGFNSTFGPYDDSNYVYFSTWHDIYIKLSEYMCHEDKRKYGKLKSTDYGFNHYSVTVISKEEYENEFKKMIDKTIETFNKWKE